MKASIALLLLTGSLSGCVGSSLKSWRVQPPPPAAVVTEQHPSRVRVSRPDHTRVVLKNPSISGDSLVGVDASRRRVALPLADVTELEVEKTSGGKVAFALVGGVAGAVAVLILWANSVGNAAR